jgi:hypothetical protein
MFEFNFKFKENNDPLMIIENLHMIAKMLSDHFLL